MKKTICLLLLLPILSIAQEKILTVAQDGTGNYTSVQAALDAVPLHQQARTVIFIRNGIYHEKLRLDSNRSPVTLVGEDAFGTILSYDDHTGKITPAGDTINTRTSASFLVKADGFEAAHITFRNDAGFSAGQAVGLEIQGDKAVFLDCRFVGNQDILFTNSDRSREYYQDCYIEGTTDFIFGSATAWFEHCHIHSKKNSHVTAASTPATHAYGYVFHDCILTGDTTLHSASLGRPWRPYASVTYLHCYIDKHIRPEGWSAWNNTDSYKMSRYAEYQDYGPGANTGQRVNWARQLTDEEARQFSPAQVLGNWDSFQELQKLAARTHQQEKRS